MAVAQIHLSPRLLKTGKVCAALLVAYCIYLSADLFLVKRLLLEPRIPPITDYGYSRPINTRDDDSKNDNSNDTSNKSEAETDHPNLEPEPVEYLRPYNTLTSTQGYYSTAMHKRYAELFRSGLGLTPFKTEDGQMAWMENGVVFRPLRDNLYSMSNRPDMKPPHASDFEYYVPFDEEKFFQGVKRPSGKSATPKIILLYTPPGYNKNIPNPRPLWLCPEFPCQITTNKNYERESSAMVFEGSFIAKNAPRRINADQVFIFHHTETPLSAGYMNNQWISQSQWRGIFNWTMSFRTDSDIPSLYGLIRKRPESLEKNYQVAMKTKMAATVMSHCTTNSKRELYIKKLQEYIQVDIFGRCGKKCARGSDFLCAKRIASQYKFYLAVENALCDDYVTEKFFRYMSNDFIIVARGGSGYFKHAPPEIFINAGDFKSPQELAKRLIYLDQHPQEYEAMLREKDKYVSMYEAYHRVDKDRISYVHHHFEAVPFCRICHRLWTLDSHRKTIPDIKAWMLNSSCYEPTDF